MTKYILSRLIQLIPTFFGIYTVTFFLTRVLPGDPAHFLLGFRGSKRGLAAFARHHEPDDPLLVQYFSFLGRTLRADLGRSYITGSRSRRC